MGVYADPGRNCPLTPPLPTGPNRRGSRPSLLARLASRQAPQSHLLPTSPCKGEVAERSEAGGGRSQAQPRWIPTRRASRADLPFSRGGWSLWRGLRNFPQLMHAARPLPDFAALHPGYGPRLWTSPLTRRAGAPPASLPQREAGEHAAGPFGNLRRGG